MIIFQPIDFVFQSLPVLMDGLERIKNVNVDFFQPIDLERFKAANMWIDSKDFWYFHHEKKNSKKRSKMKKMKKKFTKNKKKKIKIIITV